MTFSLAHDTLPCRLFPASRLHVPSGFSPLSGGKVSLPLRSGTGQGRLVVSEMSCFTERWKNQAKGGEPLEFTGKALASLCPSQRQAARTCCRSSFLGCCRLVSVGNALGMRLRQNWLCSGTEMLRDAGGPFPADPATAQLCLRDAGARCELPACSRAAGTGVTNPSA